MSFLEIAHAAGSFNPPELALLKGVYDRIIAEPWVSQDPAIQEDLARYIIGMYDRGLWSEKGLYSLCLVAARVKFADTLSDESPRKVSGQ